MSLLESLVGIEITRKEWAFIFGGSKQFDVLNLYQTLNQDCICTTAGQFKLLNAHMRTHTEHYRWVGMAVQPFDWLSPSLKWPRRRARNTCHTLHTVSRWVRRWLTHWAGYETYSEGQKLTRFVEKRGHMFAVLTKKKKKTQARWHAHQNTRRIPHPTTWRTPHLHTQLHPTHKLLIHVVINGTSLCTCWLWGCAGGISRSNKLCCRYHERPVTVFMLRLSYCKSHWVLHLFIVFLFLILSIHAYVCMYVSFSK